jgi:hypothetical protein
VQQLFVLKDEDTSGLRIDVNLDLLIPGKEGRSAPDQLCVFPSLGLGIVQIQMNRKQRPDNPVWIAGVGKRPVAVCYTVSQLAFPSNPPKKKHKKKRKGTTHA